jgi:hypothetical protein
MYWHLIIKYIILAILIIKFDILEFLILRQYYVFIYILIIHATRYIGG